MSRQPQSAFSREPSVAGSHGGKRSHLHLPEELERWVQNQRALLSQKDQIPPPREPLVVEREGRRLLVRLVEGSPGELPRTRTGAITQALEALGLIKG